MGDSLGNSSPAATVVDAQGWLPCACRCMIAVSPSRTMPRRRHDYEPIGTAHIGTLLAEALRDPRRVREALGVWPAWEQAVGPEVAAAARPVSLRNGVLTVHVKHAVWLQELHAQRASLLRRVQATSAGAEVRELRLKLAPAPVCDMPSASRREPVAPGPIPFEVARAIRAVDAPRLRGAIIRAAARWAGLDHER